MTMQCYINKKKIGNIVEGIPNQTEFNLVASLFYIDNSVGIVSEPELPKDLQ